MGSPTVSSTGGSSISRTVSGVPVLGPDLLVLGWFKINQTTAAPFPAKFFMGTANTFPVFTNDVWVGPWGTTQRGTFAVWHFRNPTPAAAQSIYYETYTTVDGTPASMTSDFGLCFLDLNDWSGNVAAESHTQNTATATSVAATITPTKNNSLLVGVAGFQDNNAHPLSPSAGWDTIATLTTGSGGAAADAAIGFFARQNSDTTAKTLTVSTAAALSAIAGYVGLLELY